MDKYPKLTEILICQTKRLRGHDDDDAPHDHYLFSLATQLSPSLIIIIIWKFKVLYLFIGLLCLNCIINVIYIDSVQHCYKNNIFDTIKDFFFFFNE